MKHLEDTPEFVCDKEKNNYCVYIDTDSNYFHAEPLLKKLHPNFDKMSNEEKDDLTEKLAIASQTMVGPILKQITKQSFNQHNPENQRIDFKNECVLRSGYIRATRRYTQYITREEGIKTNKFDIKVSFINSPSKYYISTAVHDYKCNFWYFYCYHGNQNIQKVTKCS